MHICTHYIYMCCVWKCVWNLQIVCYTFWPQPDEGVKLTEAEWREARVAWGAWLQQAAIINKRKFCMWRVNANRQAHTHTHTRTAKGA